MHLGALQRKVCMFQGSFYCAHQGICADFSLLALFQGQATFLITNDNELNSWNQTRGYAMVHTGATASQLLPDTHPLVV